MTIKVGDHLPDASFTVMSAAGPAEKSASELFSGRKVALFAVPGAYTPTCHQQHLPGFVEHAAELGGKGVDEICCTAVNDIFVLTHWAEATGAAATVTMLADGSAKFAKALGLAIDLNDHGMGMRSKRYAMIVDDGVVKVLNVEAAPSDHDKSSAATLLKGDV